jgi:hypothetical protein
MCATHSSDARNCGAGSREEYLRRPSDGGKDAGTKLSLGDGKAIVIRIETASR